MLLAENALRARRADGRRFTRATKGWLVMMLGFFNALSPMHLLLIALVALLLFGNRLPEVMRALGKSINEFKKGMHEVDDNLRDKPPARLTPPSDPTVSQQQQTTRAQEPVDR